VLCLLEGSGKWPEDIEAVRRLKASYYADLGRSLNKIADGLLTAAFTDHLDVYKVCFRRLLFSPMHFEVVEQHVCNKLIYALSVPFFLELLRFNNVLQKSVIVALIV
jgi:hypothetical protein